MADGDERRRLASAVAYAAIETVAVREGARFTLYREGEGVLAVGTESLGEQYRAPVQSRARYVQRLARRCDGLAGADPLLAPIRISEELLSVPASEGDRPVPPDRLIRLGVRASASAALSSRMEIYPQGMPAERALKLGMGSLLGPKSLTVKQIQQRIGSRYPEVEPVPGPPALDRLLAEAGIELVWDGVHQSYSPRPHRSSYLSTTSTLHRKETASLAGESAPSDLEDAWVLEECIQRAVSRHRFLILSVAPKHLLSAERELLRRFQMRRMSIESLKIWQNNKQSEHAGCNLYVVHRADSA